MEKNTDLYRQQVTEAVKSIALQMHKATDLRSIATFFLDRQESGAVIDVSWYVESRRTFLDCTKDLLVTKTCESSYETCRFFQTLPVRPSIQTEVLKLFPCPLS